MFVKYNNRYEVLNILEVSCDFKALKRKVINSYMQDNGMVGFTNPNLDFIAYVSDGETGNGFDRFQGIYENAIKNNGIVLDIYINDYNYEIKTYKVISEVEWDKLQSIIKQAFINNDAFLDLDNLLIDYK